MSLEADKRLCEGATPGPWHTSEEEPWTVQSVGDDDEDEQVAAATYEDTDAAFIARLNPAYVLKLLECIEAMDQLMAGGMRGSDLFDYETARAALDSAGKEST